MIQALLDLEWWVKMFGEEKGIEADCYCLKKIDRIWHHHRLVLLG
jgi:hypothetical protein